MLYGYVASSTVITKTQMQKEFRLARKRRPAKPMKLVIGRHRAWHDDLCGMEQGRA